MSKQPSCDKNGVAFSSIKSYKIKSDDKGMIDCYYVDNYNYNQFNDDNTYYSLININIIAIISWLHLWLTLKITPFIVYVNVKI